MHLLEQKLFLFRGAPEKSVATCDAAFAVWADEFSVHTAVALAAVLDANAAAAGSAAAAPSAAARRRDPGLAAAACHEFANEIQERLGPACCRKEHLLFGALS